MVKKLSFGRSIAEKHEELKQESEEKTVISVKDINSEISKIVSNKMEAMEKFNLKPVTKSGKYDLEKDYYDSFSFLARRLNKDIQELASEYVFDCLKRDLKKFNIPVIKNN